MKDQRDFDEIDLQAEREGAAIKFFHQDAPVRRGAKRNRLANRQTYIRAAEVNRKQRVADQVARILEELKSL